MSDKKTVAAEALRRIPYLHSDLHGAIMAALDAEGLFDSHGSGGPIRATSTGKTKTRIDQVLAEATHNRVVNSALKFAAGQLRCCGTTLDDLAVDGEISIAKLNSAMAGKPIGFRMAVKQALSPSGANLID